MTFSDILVRRSEYPANGFDDNDLHRAVSAGHLTRVVTGAYADARLWAELRPLEQHRIRVLATAERLKTPVGQRGFRKAQAAAAFATTLSDSPEESHSRVQLHLLGFPAPVLQHPFALRDGSVAEVDFFWPDFQHVGEGDGRSKYTDPAFLRGRTAQQAVIEEKNRENEIRRQVKQFSRWEPRELYPPAQLFDRLARDGLPVSRRRPGR
jgi:hypothetical protein